MPLDIPAESQRLEEEFDGLLAALDPELQAASLSLLQRCDIGTSPRLSWNARFKPLTLLYPLLEAEACAGFDPALARRLTLAHECLIVYGFLDDRLRDGQMEFLPTELDFMRRLAGEAVLRLLPEGAQSVPPDLDEAVRAAMETYQRTQSVRYAPPAEPFAVNAPRVREILGGRALYGYISTIALARLAGADEDRRRRLREAFDWIATGLQWVDDIQDLAEDLARGEENLVLRLAMEKGLDAYRMAASGAAPAMVFTMLMGSGALAEAARHAKACFTESAALHRGLGATQLAEMLTERASMMDQLESAAASLGKAAGQAG